MEVKLYLLESGGTSYTVTKGQSLENTFNYELNTVDPNDQVASTYCHKLKEAIGAFREEDELQITLKMSDNASKPVHLKVGEVFFGGISVLTRLASIFGEDALKIKLRVTNVKNLATEQQCGDLVTKDMHVFPDVSTGGRTYCAVDDEVTEAYQLKDWFITNKFTRIGIQVNFTVELTIKSKFDVVSDNISVVTASAACSSRSAFKRILDNGIGTDVEIVCKDGAVVKCHWAFLCAHSPVFQAMYGSDMEESRKNRIEMGDMTEHTLRALLAFLYYWETKEAFGNPSLAIELLKAANKYQIRNFEGVMTSILLGKPSSWYTVDSAVDLFLITRVTNDQLRNKAVVALKSICTHPNTLQASPSYQQIQNKPDILDDLVKSLMFMG